MRQSDSNTPVTNLADITTYQAGVAQSTAYRLLKKITEEAIRSHDITMMQWFIIGTIYDTGTQGITVTELSRAVDTNVPYITNTLNLLETKDIIVRDVHEKDSRSKRISINPAYAPTVRLIEQDLRQKMRDTIYTQVTPDELFTYVRVLQKLGNLTSLRQSK
jgi:DNA-binding MarR family transcriptional regulator